MNGKEWLKKIALVVTIVTGLAVLFNGYHSQFAKASEVQDLTTMVIDFKLSDLKRQLWDLLIAQDKRSLTEREKIRKLELEAEIKKLEAQRK